MRRVLAVALLLALAPVAARAGDPDVKDLEKTFKKLAKEATPKTVCIKSYIEKEGDKAGYGSGAIISKDGYILTCAHVVDIAKRCEVILPSGKVYKAEILGRNKRQDYALVKIDATDLPCYEVGDSKKLEVGQWVVALGHPGGPYEDVQPAFAAGKITGLHRKLPVQMMDRFYDDGIQTDVPIFAGNSGGPLVNLDGKLIGLNGAIILLNENAYALPIHEPMADLDTLKTGQNVAGHEPTQEELAQFQKEIDPEMWNKLLEKGFKNFGKLFGGENGENPLGKLFGEDSGELGKALKKLLQGGGGGGGKDEDGEGTDLQKLLEGFMKQFGGKDGENPFGKMFGGKDGEGMDFGKLMKQFQKMFQGGMDDDDDDKGADEQKPAQPQAEDKGGWLGVQASPEADKDSEGVVVDGVMESGPADKGGLKKGDVIVAVNGTLTKDIKALQSVVRGIAPGETAKVTVDRAKVLDTTVVRERIDLKVKIGKRDAGK